MLKGKRSTKEQCALWPMLPCLGGAAVSLIIFIIFLSTRSPPFDPADYEADYLIVGGGLSGSLLANLHATLRNETSVIIEKRDHIAGNMYDFVDGNGIRVSLYGPHFFHTKKEKVWTLLTKFSEWFVFENRVLAEVGDKVVPVPANIDTVNTLMGEKIKNEEEMLKWLEMTQVKYPNGPANAEEAAMARVGKQLYEWLFKGYTTKQWNRDPTDLAASVTQRIPVRSNRDNRYFSDPHQAEPEYGFTGLIENMLKNDKIKYFLNTDFFEFRKTIDITRYKKIFYTGPIDAYFVQQGYESLEYRSLTFRTETEHIPDGKKYVQPIVQLNRPSIDVPFTRSCEYRWIPWKPRPSIGSTASTVIYEYPSNDGEPYYPVPNPRNRELFEKYQELAVEEEKNGVYFIGRLANYKYFNMDDATLNVIDFYEKMYNVHLPVIEQDLIFITVTLPPSGFEPIIFPTYEPRYEDRLMELCQLGHSIRLDGGTYWIVVENGEQTDLQVHLMIDELGFQHYAYTAVGPSGGEKQQKELARQYIEDNKMDDVATVHEVEQGVGVLDASFFAQARKGSKNPKANPSSSAEASSVKFCESVFHKLHIPI